VIDVRKSIVLAVSQERKRAWAAQEALRDRILLYASKWEAILRERDEALAELHQLKLRMARAAAQRQEIARLRAEAAFACLQREPDTLLN